MRSIESSFSKSAETYDKHSEVQKLIVDHLVSLIPVELKPKSVIDIGTGTGNLAFQLSSKFTNLTFDLCDISSEMLKISSRRVNCDNLLCVNFEDLNTAKKYDLVVSSAALHWSESFTNIAKILANICNPNLAISIMLDGTLIELRKLREQVAASKKIKPVLYNLEYYTDILSPDFDIKISDIKTYTLYYDSPELALESLRKTGVNGGSSEKLSKDEYLKLVELYADTFKTKKGFPLTYKAGYIIAKKS